MPADDYDNMLFSPTGICHIYDSKRMVEYVSDRRDRIWTNKRTTGR